MDRAIFEGMGCSYRGMYMRGIEDITRLYAIRSWRIGNFKGCIRNEKKHA
nr:hypothetical protein [uncultured archaeon]CAI64241.1 hypothetical protein [uncultured archaeon]